METLRADSGRPHAGLPAELSPEERRVHQLLTEVREGLDASRLAEAAGIPKLTLYRVLDALRTRGLVEIYPGSPVLFYASEGRGPPTNRTPGARLGPPRGVRPPGSPAPPDPSLRPAPPRAAPEPPAGPPLRPTVASGPAGGGLLLFLEPRPERSLERYRAAVRRGARGLLIGRSPPASEPGSRLHLGGRGPAPRAERLDEVVRAAREAGAGAAILLDGLEYLIVHHGFDSVLRMVHRLREVAAAQGALILLPVDPRTLEPRQRALLERETEVA